MTAIGVSPGPKSCSSARMERRTSINPGFEKNSGLQGPFVRDHCIMRPRAHLQLLNGTPVDGVICGVLTLNSSIKTSKHLRFVCPRTQATNKN